MKFEISLKELQTLADYAYANGHTPHHRIVMKVHKTSDGAKIFAASDWSSKKVEITDYESRTLTPDKDW